MYDQSRRAPDEQSLFAREPPRHRKRLLVGYRHEVVDHTHVERAWQLVLSNAFHLVRPAFRLALPLGAPHLAQDRANRIAGDYLNFRILLLQEAADAGDGAPGARRVHEMRNAAAGLLPDFWSGGRVVRVRVGL